MKPIERPDVEDTLSEAEEREEHTWSAGEVAELCRWIIHVEKGFGEAIRRPMGVVPAGHEDILQEDGKR